MQRSTDIQYNDKILSVITGDITFETTDAIVNAANSSLLGGGGVDGAIHRGAGRELLEYCRTLRGCPPGSAKISPGFKLPAKYIIHTVGPVYQDGKSGEAEVLRSCYQSSLQLADEKELTSIAFPAISTGVYRFPMEEAAKIAVDTVMKYLRGNTTLRLVRFVLYGGDFEGLYLRYIKDYFPSPQSSQS
ncbi:MAG: O-acetyl-ADP-ribose deacetylase [Spirochaetales bacterium]|nr:O-acetyl-ADP-ribose deacetylase [Spirochaetales bacterium]